MGLLLTDKASYLLHSLVSIREKLVFLIRGISLVSKSLKEEMKN